jgi:predicted enzyme related to lactoylglutathione lyase
MDADDRSRPVLRAVDAVQIPVTDLEAALTFYGDTLGQNLRWRTDTEAGLGMPEAQTEIVLTTERDRLEPNLLVESADEAAQSIEAQGGTIDVAPFDIPVGRVAVVRDPFGNVLVLIDLSKGRYVTDESGAVTGVE